MIQLNEFLRLNHVISYTPMRIDCGSIWDISTLALSYPYKKPTTVNIAIAYYIKVELLPYKEHAIAIESKEYGLEIVNYDKDYNPKTNYPVIFAILSHFNIKGVKLKIISDLPPQLGFGGSASVSVGVISAINTCLYKMWLSKKMSKRQIALLAYTIESSFIKTGIQDHMAAAFGGVNQWIWNFVEYNKPYIKYKLFKNYEIKQLESKILIAYSVKKHKSFEVLNKLLKSFSINRKKWLKVNKLCIDFSKELKLHNWDKAINILKKEFNLRYKMDSFLLTKDTKLLIKEAENHHCAGRFIGAGNCGGVWAFGKEINIEKLRKKWEKISSKNKNITIIPVKISKQGTLVKIKTLKE